MSNLTLGSQLKPLTPIIEIVHLKKSFGKKVVLKDINLKVKTGENVVILGKSGVGKSVLIKCIIGLMTAQAERLLVLGREVTRIKGEELNDIRKKIGFLFQSSALYDSMTVKENLEFPLKRKKEALQKADIDKLVEEALDNVGLREAINKMPNELSGGMRKRIGLARTLILKPEIMLYDEPTTGLDPITSKEISHLIMEIKEKYNTTAIIISHDVGCAKITADRILVLKDGIFIAEGNYKELEESSIGEVKAFFE